MVLARFWKHIKSSGRARIVSCLFFCSASHGSNCILGDNLLQEASWRLVQGDISETSIDLPSDITNNEAAADMRKLRSALRSLLQVLWVNVTAEGTSLIQDFASVIRLALADTAEIIEARGRGAKEGLRDVEAGVQGGERDILGRKKKSKEEMEAESDPKMVWEKGMDTVKDAGSTVIGTGQSTKEAAEDAGEKTSSRLTDAYYNVGHLPLFIGA
jgi:hypothetical protein